MTLSERIYTSAGWLFPAVATAAALAAAAVVDPYLAYVATSWLIFGLLGLSLDIVWGRGGFLSLGQTAFYGLGGYVGGVVAINVAAIGGVPLLWSLPAGALCGAIAAFALGAVIFLARMGPLQSTILSYTSTLLLWSVSQSFALTAGAATIGGDNGMSNIPGYAIWSRDPAEALGPAGVFAVVTIICAAVYFITRWLMTGTFGKVVDCIRIDIQKAELLGYDVRKYQIASFAYAGAVAGLAGAMFGAWSNYLNPSDRKSTRLNSSHSSVSRMPLGTLAGAFVGAVAIGGLSFWLGGGAVGGQTTLVLGVVLVVLVLFLRNGILGTIGDIWAQRLPGRDAAAKEAGAVSIDTDVLERLLEDAARQFGPAKPLVTRDAFKRFGGVVSVNNVSRTFAPGQPFSLIGPNGAGKSSYLKTCIGIYPPDAGCISIGEADVSRAPIFARVRNGLGVKNQKPQVFGELSVFDNLWVAAFARTRRREAADKIANQILTMLGLQHQSGAAAATLSHGQQQWLDIGMVLCLAPRVVLLDEPAAGMTNAETRELSSLVRTLARHMTAVVVEHDMEFIRTLNGHVTVLHQGAVFAEGDIDALRGNDQVLDIYLGRRRHV